MFACSIRSHSHQTFQPSFETAVASTQADMIQQPLAISLEDESGQLNKARARNRLAQRKHRQRKKALSIGALNEGNGDVSKSPQRQSYNKAALGAQPVIYRGKEGSQNRNRSREDDTNSLHERFQSAISPVSQTSDPCLTAVNASSIDQGISALPEDFDISMRDGTDSGAFLLNRDVRPHGFFDYGPNNNFTNYLQNLGGSGLDPFNQEVSRHVLPKRSCYPCSCDAHSRLSFELPSDWHSAKADGTAHDQQTHGAQFLGANYTDHVGNCNKSVPAYLSVSPRSEKPAMISWPSQANYIGHDTDNFLDAALCTSPLYKLIPTPSTTPIIIDPPTYSKTPLKAVTPPPSSAVQQTEVQQTDTTRNPRQDEMSRLEIVFNAIDEAGFDSLDSMAAAYYTSRFPQGSSMHSAQALSKKRHLKKLLKALNQSAKDWEFQDAQSYREGIMRCAEDIFIDELQSIKLNGMTTDGKESVIEKLEAVFVNNETQELMKDNKRYFKERATETWSLLMEVGKAIDIPQARNAQIVSAFLCMLAYK